LPCCVLDMFDSRMCKTPCSRIYWMPVGQPCPFLPWAMRLPLEGQDNTTATTFIGHEHFFMMGVENYAYWFYQFAFAATSATIVAGTLAERCQMAAYFCYSVWMTAFVFPVVAHAVWSSNGFLSASNVEPLWGTGMIDFSGSGVVHTTGGATALFATMVLGPRRGRFYDNRGNPLRKPTHIPGHSVALQVLYHV
jgi:ammonium transporter, Amt family